MQWRAYTARDAYKKKRTALIMLQSAFRMRLERVRFLKYRAARMLQVGCPRGAGLQPAQGHDASVSCSVVVALVIHAPFCTVCARHLVCFPRWGRAHIALGMGE